MYVLDTKDGTIYYTTIAEALKAQKYLGGKIRPIH